MVDPCCGPGQTFSQPIGQVERRPESLVHKSVRLEKPRLRSPTSADATPRTHEWSCGKPHPAGNYSILAAVFRLPNSAKVGQPAQRHDQPTPRGYDGSTNAKKGRPAGQRGMEIFLTCAALLCKADICRTVDGRGEIARCRCRRLRAVCHYYDHASAVCGQRAVASNHA